MKGRGLKVRDWRLDAETETPDDVVESMVDWCKEAMARSRRPYGYDHFDLVLTLRTSQGVRRLRYNHVRVMQLYDESLARDVVSSLGRELRETGAQVMDVAAGLFSWGDALHAALGPSEQPASR